MRRRPRPQILGGDGQTLDFGRTTRRHPPALRRYLISRDGGCVFPGCDAPPGRTEVHHISHWADGGPTSRDNTCLQCLPHHHMLHEDGWILTGNPDIAGELRYQPPDPNAPPLTAERKTSHRVIRTLLDTLRAPGADPPDGEPGERGEPDEPGGPPRDE